MNRQFVIYRVTHGRYKGQWRFTLLADNYEPIASSESYANYMDVVDVGVKYFPEFEQVEKETKKELKAKKNAKL